MSDAFHQVAMWSIFLGSLALLYLAFVWFSRGNTIMGFGMLVMGVVAAANYYLHRMMMETKKGS